MTLLRDFLQARRERRERLRDIARVRPEEIASFGLSQGEFTALALMPTEQIARLEEMARINGCDPSRLDRDRDLRVAVSLTCTACGEQSRCRRAIGSGTFREGTDFCPNAETYRMLAAE